ncbi:MAG: hypothetical protein K8T25_08710 [Planctomycetia bacterium]|nr:hypothetical protein [Planctomycetia bacterium]
MAGSSVGAALPNPARHGEWPLAGLGMRAPLDVYLPAQPAPQSAADFMQADDGLPAQLSI